jgi:predicted transcriptional regulator
MYAAATRDGVVRELNEFDRFLGRLAHDITYGNQEARFGVLAQRNRPAAMLKYMHERAAPAKMKDIVKACGGVCADENAYNFSHTMKHIRKKGLTSVDSDSKINRYELTEYGLKIAEIMTVIENIE